jgi:hypothetical protein
MDVRLVFLFEHLSHIHKPAARGRSRGQAAASVDLDGSGTSAGGAGVDLGGSGTSAGVHLHIPSTRSATKWHGDGLCWCPGVRPTGVRGLRTDASAQAGYRTDHGQQGPREGHTRTPGTGLAPPAGEPARAPRPVHPACIPSLRPGGWQCWMCGQPGRADPAATAYFCCDGCDVRWYGGTRRPRRSPQFTQRE